MALPHTLDRIPSRERRPSRRAARGLRPVSGALAATVRLAFRGVSPASHHLYHAGVRRAVWAFMLPAQRVDSGLAGATIVGFERLSNGSALPIELWLMILGFVLRRDWPVPLLRSACSRTG